MITRYELTPVQRISCTTNFYGKAIVEATVSTDPELRLYDLWSYNTRVATVNLTTGRVWVAAKSPNQTALLLPHSPTTVRHIRTFLSEMYVSLDQSEWTGRWINLTAADVYHPEYDGKIH